MTRLSKALGTIAECCLPVRGTAGLHSVSLQCETVSCIPAPSPTHSPFKKQVLEHTSLSQGTASSLKSQPRPRRQKCRCQWTRKHNFIGRENKQGHLSVWAEMWRTGTACSTNSLLVYYLPPSDATIWCKAPCSTDLVPGYGHSMVASWFVSLASISLRYIYWCPQTTQVQTLVPQDKGLKSVLPHFSCLAYKRGGGLCIPFCT